MSKRHRPYRNFISAEELLNALRQGGYQITGGPNQNFNQNPSPNNNMGNQQHNPNVMGNNPQNTLNALANLVNNLNGANNPNNPITPPANPMPPMPPGTGPIPPGGQPPLAGPMPPMPNMNPGLNPFHPLGKQPPGHEGNKGEPKNDIESLRQLLQEILAILKEDEEEK